LRTITYFGFAIIREGISTVESKLGAEGDLLVGDPHTGFVAELAVFRMPMPDDSMSPERKSVVAMSSFR
jgi:hypothetical protein